MRKMLGLKYVQEAPGRLHHGGGGGGRREVEGRVRLERELGM